jgi:energy-coupling factor transporter ATP-binding protein EcfA2
MRITDFYMKNFIPFYNGMGLREVKIDNIDRHGKRMIFIRGDNGSGKSTLLNALSPLLDDKNNFIEKCDGEKQLRIIDGNDVYNIRILYLVRGNGDRDNTKAYFVKNGVELNANGNVTSYKELVALEFNLDSNFEALCRLSCEDKGMVVKTPSERKRYVSFIIDEVADYNTMQKTFVKRSSNYNSMLNQISLKLQHLGNPELLEADLKRYMLEKDDINKKIETNAITLGEIKSKIDSLNAYETKQKYQEIANKILFLNNINDEKLKSISGLKNVNVGSIAENIGIMTIELTQTQSLLNELTQETIRIKSIIDSKQEMLNSLNSQKMLNSDESLVDMRNNMDKLTEWINDTISIFESVGYDYNSRMDTDKLIGLYNIFLDIDNRIDVFNSSFSVNLMEELFNNPEKDFSIDKLISQYENDKANIPYSLEELEAKLELLNEKPKDCKLSCPFILKLSKVNLPTNEIQRYIGIYKQLESQYFNIEQQREQSYTYMKAQQMLHDIFRAMYMNSRDLPAFGLKCIETIYDAIGYMRNHITYTDAIQRVIDISSLIDEFNSKKIAYDDYVSKMQSMSYNEQMITDLETDIRNQTILFNQRTDELKFNKNKEQKLNFDISFNTQALDSLTIINNNNRDIEELSNKRKLMETEFLQISDYDAQINHILNTNNNLRNMLTTLDNNIYKINHALQSKAEYELQYSEFMAKYSKLETFKKYSNPSKDGIQVAFIELYMHKVISMCNELLQYVLDGEYSLQKCIVNENEFKIPCIGSGLLIDDVSHMSSGQRAIIGSTMSFALMHHSSSKYNIIGMDEVDAELDSYNRRNLIEVINREMDILGVEQLFVISHNTEYNTDDGAIIELSHKGDRLQGNVIWSYFDL